MRPYWIRSVTLILGGCILASCGSVTPPSTATPSTQAESGEPCPSARAPIEGQIVFISENKLMSIAADGNTPKELLVLQPGMGVTDPAWSPDGKTLAYTFAYPNPDTARPWLQQGKICGLDRASGKGRMLAQTVDTISVLEDPSWTPDGVALLVTQHSYQFDQNNALLGETISGVRYVLGQTSGAVVIKDGRSPAMSPDGTRIAFIQIDPQTYVMTLMATDGQGQNPTKLFVPTNIYTTIQDPLWAPDGSRLTFTMSDDETQSNGGGVQADTRSLFDILLGVEVAEAHGVPANIWLLNLSDSQPKRLTPQGLDDPRIAWSPDGRSLAFTTGTSGVTVLDVDTSQQRQLSTLGDYGGISWAWK